MTTIVGVCGYSGAGKSTFCREMARRFALPVLSTGEVVRRQVVERGYVLRPENVARVSDEIRRETGQRFLRILETDLRAGLGRSPAVLVDCLRESSDLLALRELAIPGAKVAVVAIVAGEEVRASRALGRGRPGDPDSRAGRRALEDRERRLGVETLVAEAGHRIDNDGAFDVFLERSAAVLETLLAPPCYNPRP